MSYVYNPAIHNATDPGIIVPLLVDYFKPTSVIDIGCGIGNFLAEFKKMGVSKVLGVDDDTASNSLRLHNLSSNEFLLQDLNQPFTVNGKFDIALCLEVAEHLNEQSADALVGSLVRSSDIVIFSAAIPFQGGQYHINEQWQDYWQQKFQQFNYLPIDLIRPLIWDNTNVKYWYKQNIIVYISVSHTFFSVSNNQSSRYFNLVHPDNYIPQVSYLQKILSGEASFIFYCYLLFKYFKSIIRSK